MSKRIIAVLCCIAVVLFPPPSGGNPTDAAAAGPILVTFSDANITEFHAAGNTLETGDQALGEVVKGEADHDGDGAAFKVTRNADSTNYTSINNGAQINFGTPLPAETNYVISAWFYVPLKGNEDKAPIIGPGSLVNGNAGSNEYKYPTSAAEAGIIPFDTWTQAIFETPAYGDEINFIIFRFYTNDKETHPEVWYLDDVSITTFTSDENTELQDLPELKDAYKDYFMFGTAGGATDLSGKRLDLITRHFDTFTFGNEMKPDALQRTEGEFTFDTVGRMTDTLKANGLNIIGHTLLWHSQSPDWFWSDADKAVERMETHIETVLRNTGADLTAIDVVNEAFTNSTGTGSWRDELRKTEGWYTALGADFIEIAFRKAGEVRDAIGRPDLKLYYNDFNLDEPNKAAKVYEMVAELRGKGVPIDGIGMQGHYNKSTSPNDVQRSLELFSTIPGIEVSVTELDITIQSALGNRDLSESEEKHQAALYAQLFSIYKRFAQGPANTNPDKSQHVITRVTLWGTTDNLSWRSDRFPLLFDRNFQAKGAFYAVLDPEGYMRDNNVQDPAKPYEPPKAIAVRGTPVIDGEMDDIWNGTQEIAVNNPVSSGPVNASAAVRTMWDDEYLYVYAVVTDPVLDEAATAAHEQDSIEVFVSERNHRDASYIDGDGQYRVSFTNRQSFNASNVSNDGFDSAAKIIDGGYVIEMAIKLYAVKPGEGNIVGFDVQVNDADGGRRNALAIWSDFTGMGYRDASNWGELTLLSELPAEEEEETGGDSAPETIPSSQPTAPAPPAAPDDESPNYVLWVILGGLLLVGGAAAAALIIINRKKAANTDKAE